MIGHYLLVLDAAAEDRVLTSRLAPGRLRFDDGSGCLVGVAAFSDDDGIPADWRAYWRSTWGGTFVGIRYDRLCRRFGEARTNAAIRNRILSNRARRALAGVREAVSV